jgi:hypothetical protein
VSGDVQVLGRQFGDSGEAVISAHGCNSAWCLAKVNKVVSAVALRCRY